MSGLTSVTSGRDSVGLELDAVVLAPFSGSDEANKASVEELAKRIAELKIDTAMALNIMDVGVNAASLLGKASQISSSVTPSKKSSPLTKAILEKGMGATPRSGSSLSTGSPTRSPSSHGSSPLRPQSVAGTVPTTALFEAIKEENE